MNAERRPPGKRAANEEIEQDHATAAYAVMAATACRDAFGNCAQGCVDSFEAGRAVGRQEALDELAENAWPRAVAVARGAARSVDVLDARRRADGRMRAVSSR